MRSSIHPGLFLAVSIAASAAVLWLRAPDDGAVFMPVGQVRAAAPPTAARQSVQLDDATLRRHAGRYAVDGATVEIAVDDGALVADAGSAGRYRLLATSETEFFFADLPGGGRIEFSGDDGGHSTRIVVDHPGGRSTATRIPGR